MAESYIQLRYNDWWVTLPRPLFGDIDSYQQNRINRKTRGGDLTVFRDPQWPVTEKLTFSFDYLDKKLIDEYVLFSYITNGQLIQLVDYRGRIWNGILMNPDAAINQPGRFDRALTVEFLVNALLSDIPIGNDNP